MLGLGAATRIYVATGATDMRLGYDGLYGLVRDRLACDPLSGHLYLFANARRDRLKVLFFDGSGLWVCAKRMEGGRLRWPEPDASGDKVQLSREQFALLLGGIDLAETRPRKWYRRPLREEPHASRKTA
jgi:transposase